MIPDIAFIPLVSWPLLAGFALLFGLFCLFSALWRQRGWVLRGAAGLVILLMLSGPVYQQIERSPLSDIVLLIEDTTASQRLGTRAQQTQEAVQKMRQQLEALDNIEVRHVTLTDDPDRLGSLLKTALMKAMGRIPAERLAGVIAISDGQIHDAQMALELPAPFHLLQSGHSGEWDRKLTLKNAPAFGILNEDIEITVDVKDFGAAALPQTRVPLDVRLNDHPLRRIEVPLGQPLRFSVTLEHAGRNVISISTPALPGELSAANNARVLQINGIRDRLRVLLVSGQPHAGGRTWRNLLKSDGAVDLVHFTIMRPMNKFDPAPTDEVSLIAFPTRELFLEKINDFDLIIFDRYKMRGILPPAYLENVVKYVREGGAVLIAAGPDFASADSIYRSPLQHIIPAKPTARIRNERFTPKLSPLGQRHPVTAALPMQDTWGRWLRQIEVQATSGQVVMEGIDGLPLLILDRIDKGRVAVLASDHAWLWTRGYEGGGPQLELLRRLGHWMMKEPELEEEALVLDAKGQTIHIKRRSLAPEIGPLTVTRPDASQDILSLTSTGAGQFAGEYQGTTSGVYHFESDGQRALIGLGADMPREFENILGTPRLLAPLIHKTNGGAYLMEDGLPQPRLRARARSHQDTRWLDLTPRHAFDVRNITQQPLLPVWLVLLAAGALLIFAWLREGVRHNRSV